MTHTAKRTALLCILPLLLLAALFCLPKAALAATIDVVNPGSGAGWDYNGSTKTLTISSGVHTLTGNNSELRIVVDGGVTALTLESLTATVHNGRATGTFARLSPFAVVLGAQVTVPDEVELDPPKTGDAGAPLGFMLLALGLLVAVGLRGRMKN